MPLFLRSILSLLFILTAVGCADSVDPTYDADKPYTLYGVLDPTASRQALRVVPFEPDLNPRDPGPLGAEIASTDLQTGETVLWRDSLVTFGGDRFGYVYLADFRPVYRHTYRVEARRAEATGTSVEQVIEASMSNQSIKRLVQPREIGALAVFLASDAALSISGQVIPIDNDYQRN